MFIGNVFEVNELSEDLDVLITVRFAEGDSRNSDDVENSFVSVFFSKEGKCVSFVKGGDSVIMDYFNKEEEVLLINKAEAYLNSKNMKIKS